MDVCRVCLAVGPDKHIYQLTLRHEDCAVQYPEIVGLCLGNEYLEQNTKVNKLCKECFSEILRFYKFKSQALKNDAYLRSIDINTDVTFQQVTIKHENVENEKNLEPDLTEIQEDTVGNGINQRSDETLEEKISNLQKEVKIKIHENNLIHQEDDIRKTEINDEDVQFELKYEFLEDESNFVNEDTNLADENTYECKFYNEASNPGSTEADSDASEESSNSYVGRDPPSDDSDYKPIDCKRQKKLQPKRKRSKDKASLNRRRQPSGSIPVQHGNKTPVRGTCPVCSKVMNADYLRKHMMRTHGNRTKPCPYCNKEFSVYYMKKHVITTHEPEKMKYKCQKCDKRFINPYRLREHWCPSDGPITRKRKRAVLAFSCTQCKKRLQSSESLQKHVARVHEGPQRFLCQYCSKRCNDKRKLLNHIRTHTKERPFKCEQCSKSFATKEGLRNHQYTHAKSRDFQCEQCDKSFAAPYYLSNHVHNVHSAARFPCRYCALQFTRPDNRTTHEKNKHADEMPPFEVTLNGIIVNKETEKSSVKEEIKRGTKSNSKRKRK